MSRNLIPIVLIYFINNAFAQSKKIDSLLNILNHHNSEDTNKVILLSLISLEFCNNNDFEVGLEYSELALKLAEKLKFKGGVAFANEIMGNIFCRNLSNYEKALTCHLNALEIYMIMKTNSGEKAKK